MADLGNFDASTVEPMSDEYEPLPEGLYRMMITESEVKRNKADTGNYLALTMELTGNEQYDKRKLFVNLNLSHPNPVAVEIAQKELSSICRAVGNLRPGDSTKLHDIPFFAKVTVDKRKDTGALTNNIRKYISLDDAEQEKSEAPAEKKSGADWMN